MVLPGHLSGGYLAARAVLFFAHASFSPVRTTILLVVGTLAGEAPDVDLIPFYFNRRSKTAKKIGEHRDYPTHAPAVWLTLCLLIVAVGYIRGSIFIQFIGWVILAGSWSHFILDSIEHGISWLWPFSKKRFCLREAPVARTTTAPEGTLKSYWQFITGAYRNGWTIYAELFITLAAIWALFH